MGAEGRPNLDSVAASARMDEATKRYRQSEKGKEAARRFHSSDKGKKAHRKYNNSDKAKLNRFNYQNSEKGQEALSRASTKAKTLRLMSQIIKEEGMSPSEAYNEACKRVNST